ncbi:MAG: hypothetical protein QN144_13695 [Armatimonadota bacterium]|nr:hypothetical protein [Armatimonadota bacterium]
MDWLTRWPQVLTQLDAVVVVVDSSGLLGAGVVKEVVDASARGLPVFFFKPDGQLVPLRRAQLRFLEVSRRRFAAVSFERGESG